jgi:hypothetical protein
MMMRSTHSPAVTTINIYLVPKYNKREILWIRWASLHYELWVKLSHVLQLTRKLLT